MKVVMRDLSFRPCAALLGSPCACEGVSRREVRYEAPYAPVKPDCVPANGMQAHNALHSSNSGRRNSFDSVECPAPGALSSSAACLPLSPLSPLLMLSLRDLCRNVQLADLLGPASILSAGTPACHKLSYAEIVAKCS